MTPAVLARPHLRLDVHRFELACGARLIVSPRDGAPVFATHVHIRGGHSLDPEGLGGTAYLTGALADQGTRAHTEEQLAELLEPAGGQIHGDATGLSGTIAGGDWKLLLDTLAELTLEPTYPRRQVERQRQRLVDRLTIDRDDPRIQTSRMFRRLVYGDHWLGRPVNGTAESVAGIERRHLVAHHRKHWCPQRATFAVCGDVDPKAVLRHLDRRLAGWKSRGELGALDQRWPKPSLRTGVFRADRQQVHVCLGHLGIRRRNPDFATLVVLDHVLGTGPGLNDRMSRRLREELGLAYTVYANISSSSGVTPGVFSAYIGTSPEHVGTAVQGFLDEMRRIRDERVPRDELSGAKDYLLGSYVLGFQRATRRVGYLTSLVRHGLPDDHIDKLLAEFAAVTAADVQRAARAHLHPDACCVAAGGPVSPRDLDRWVRAASGV